jgi:hypothetical protein
MRRDVQLPLIDGRPAFIERLTVAVGRAITLSVALTGCGGKTVRPALDFSSNSPKSHSSGRGSPQLPALGAALDLRLRGEDAGHQAENFRHFAEADVGVEIARLVVVRVLAGPL